LRALGEADGPAAFCFSFIFALLRSILRRERAQLHHQDLGDDSTGRVLSPLPHCTGIVSFAHEMFFGVGAYGVSLPLYAVGTNWSALVIGFIAAAAGSGDRLSPLRVQPIFFAMATPAVAYALQHVRFAALGGDRGEDGRSCKVPEALQLGPNLVQDKAFGVVITGKI
jgi:hypothetical protein